MEYNYDTGTVYLTLDINGNLIINHISSSKAVITVVEAEALRELYTASAAITS